MNRTDSTSGHARRWPLILIAAPAAVAIWSGWVKLGGMCGFGLVQPFPGIVSWHLNTAITLPVGVETYGAYALGIWIALRAIPDRARTFAKWSAIGALLLGMAGQVIVHLLAAANAQRAPWPVVVLVSCMPVVVLGLGAALTHLLRDGKSETARETKPQAGKFPSPVPGSAEAAAEASMRATLAAGNPWKPYALQTQFGIARKTATEIHERVLAEASPNGQAPHE